MSIETEREYKRGKRNSNNGFSFASAYEYFKEYTLQILVGYFLLFFMIIYLYIPAEALIELRTPDTLTKLSSRTVAGSIPGLVELRSKIHNSAEIARSKSVVFPSKITTSILQDVSGVEVIFFIPRIFLFYIGLTWQVLFSLQSFIYTITIIIVRCCQSTTKRH